MQRERHSRTADSTTIFRALESSRPESDRICYDPFARKFLGTFLGFLNGNRVVSKVMFRLFVKEGFVMQVYGDIVARTRYIDDRLTESSDRIGQLVILGAGFDSRAYRFPALKAHVFELDHPAMLDLKKAKVKKELGSLPPNVTYVPIDFDSERLDELLLSTAYDPDAVTFFTWEGVTMYLSADAVDETLAFVREHSAPGSTIVFNYVFRSVVEGTSDFRGAKEWVSRLERVGESPTFGIEEGTVEKFLSDRGFGEIESPDYVRLAEGYFAQAGRRLDVAHFIGLASGAVCDR